MEKIEKFINLKFPTITQTYTYLKREREMEKLPKKKFASRSQKKNKTCVLEKKGG